MKEFDKETVRKIWERVQSDKPLSPPENDSLSEWIAWELSFADIYRRLAGRIPGQDGQTLRRLARQEQRRKYTPYRYKKHLLRCCCGSATEKSCGLWLSTKKEPPTAVLVTFFGLSCSRSSPNADSFCS